MHMYIYIWLNIVCALANGGCYIVTKEGEKKSITETMPRIPRRKTVVYNYYQDWVQAQKRSLLDNNTGRNKGRV